MADLDVSNDGVLQVAADGSGKKVDNSVLTREDGTVVYRQRVVIGGEDNPRQQVTAGGESGQTYLLVDSRSFDDIVEKLDELIEVIKFLNGMS